MKNKVLKNMVITTTIGLTCSGYLVTFMSNTKAATMNSTKATASSSSVRNPFTMANTNLSVTKEITPDDNNLQKTIDDARSKGIEVNVSNKTVTVLSSNLDEEQKKIQGHYADEIKAILKTEDDYAKALKKADDDYNAAMKKYKDDISHLPNPGGINPNTIHNNISLVNQGNQNGHNVSIKDLNGKWQSWTGIKDANSDNGWQGGKANTPSWVASLPGGWTGQGNKVTVLAPKGGTSNPELNSIGTVKIELNQPGYYKDPVTGDVHVIKYLLTHINSIGGREVNHYRDHNINLVYGGDLGLTGSWHTDQINNTDQFLDENGNAINFKDGGGYFNDEHGCMNEKDGNGKVIDWTDPNNPDKNHWWAGPKEWNNWTAQGGTTFYGTAGQWGDGAQDHEYVGSSIYKHSDGWYYSDSSNMKIWNAGAPMNGSVASNDKNNPAWNETTNHGQASDYDSSGTMLHASKWDHSEKLLDNAQNSFGNLGYQYDAVIPKVPEIPTPPVKQVVPKPKINIDKTDINQVTPTLDKKVTNDGKDINGKNLDRGDNILYQIGWDLTGLENLKPNETEISKGLSITDNYDSRAELNLIKIC